MVLEAGKNVFKISLRSYEIQCTENIRRSNFCKDHRDKIEVPDPLVVEDLISDKLNNKRKLARLIKQYRDIFSNISQGTAFLLQGVTENDSSFKRYKFNIRERRYN